MCGITGIFCRESVPDYKYLDILFKGTETRGQDGFGFIIISKNDNGKRGLTTMYKSELPYSKCKDEVKQNIEDHNCKIGDVVK
jgi:asparagine synthetase B (glutamine-hydrolysing)